MSQFLLAHGAFHGAWCWRKTVAELEKRGHRAKAIDLPGQGEDRTPLKEVTLDTMVDRIIAEMADLPGQVVLVGHSLGGDSHFGYWRESARPHQGAGIFERFPAARRRSFVRYRRSQSETRRASQHDFR